MMVRAVLFFSFLIFLTSSIWAQNMVINPSFEYMKNCPYTMNQLKFTESWFPFGTADPSPDLFHACDLNGQMGIPKNIFGIQKARSGDAYVGMITYLTTRSGNGWKVPANHREFIMVQLTKPLVAGNKYYAEMWVNLADFCEYSTSSIGMNFTPHLLHMDWQAIDLGYYKPQINSNLDTLIDRIDTWTKVSGTFTAKGDELALTIGNFHSDSKILTKKTKRKFPFEDERTPKAQRPQIAYYFIDDVLVRPVDPKEPIYPEDLLVKKDTTSEEGYFGPAIVGRKVILQNIYFEFDKSDFLPKSFTELDKLYRYLKENNRVKIQVDGHTDDVGDDEYNIKLAFQRAKAVTGYLKWKGINEFRLEYKGYGSRRPIVGNETEEGRSLNRRVEFTILSN